LIPKDFAAPATLATKRQVEELRRKRAEREAAELNEAQELAGKLASSSLSSFSNRARARKRAFGAVTNLDIATKAQRSGIRSRPQED